MLLKKILLLLLIMAAMLAGLWLNGYLKQKLQPYQSTRGGLLFLLLHFLAILVLVFMVSWAIIYWRGFFFQA
jgi:uncharacterized protein HemY